VRERAPFAPMPSDAQIRFADQVVLIRAPFRVTLCLCRADQVWQPNWRDQMQLPGMIRVTVRDRRPGRCLRSPRATVHVNAPAECARAKSVTACLTARLKPDAEKKEEQL
jgi:general secretion pathway protein J